MRVDARSTAVALLAGGYANLAFDTLLPVPWLAALAAMTLVVAGFVRRRGLALAGLFLLGWAILAGAADSRIGDRLDPELVGKDQDVPLRIIAVSGSDAVWRIDAVPLEPRLPGRIRLSWYRADAAPAIGQCWSMRVRLRQPRGFANPVRFDYEAWLFTRGTGATGYIKKAELLPACPGGTLDGWRQQRAERIRAQLPDDDATAVLLGISLGLRQWLDDGLWERFAVTGTSHLMAISGMHIALAAALAFGLTRVALSAAGLAWNLRASAAAAAFAAALGYAIASGFGIPARRAVVMLAVALLVLVARRRGCPWQALGVAACLIVCLQPLDSLGTGFRLSFMAVFLLAWLPAGQGRRLADPARRLAAAVAGLMRLQGLLLVGMLPLTAATFGRVSWLAPPVNLVLVPVFSFVALPGALAGAFVPGAFGEGCLWLAWKTLSIMLEVMQAAAELPLADWRPALGGMNAWAAPAFLALAGIAPRGWPGRPLAWIAALAVCFPQQERPPQGCIDVHALDVGQGLAVVLQTAEHSLLYDAGPAFRSGGDTGTLVVAPFLTEHGIAALDRVIVSHADNDHAGSIGSVLAAVPAGSILAGEADELRVKLPHLSIEACTRGRRWHFDGVFFRVLHPGLDTRDGGNDASCVLEVRTGDRRLLLTGDIEAAAERELVAAGALSESEVVFIPHHGSRTSSSTALVRETRASIVISSTGFDNRWNMPLPDIVRRWTDRGAIHYDTARDGAIGLRLCPDVTRLRYRQRVDGRKFWHAR